MFVFAVVGPLAANEFGWVAAEVGRQPWVVHPPVEWNAAGDLVVGPAGVVAYDEGQGLRTAAAASPSVSGGQVFGSILAFGLVYLGLLAVWLYVLDQKIRHGPEAAEAPKRTGHEGIVATAARRAGRSDSMTGSKERD
jgi:cytochrome d ubiquinol oxidase subunit I